MYEWYLKSTTVEFATFITSTNVYSMYEWYLKSTTVEFATQKNNSNQTMVGRRETNYWCTQVGIDDRRGVFFVVIFEFYVQQYSTTTNFTVGKNQYVSYVRTYGDVVI